MAELKPVKFHCEELEKYSVFRIIRFEVKYNNEVLGYYRVWHDPETENIAFYGVKNPKDKHGVLPPGMYKSIPQNHKLIRYIEEDLNKMGYTIPDAHEKVTDAMIIGNQKFPIGWDAIY